MRWSDWERMARQRREREAEEAKLTDLEVRRLALRGEFNPALDTNERLDVLLRYLRKPPGDSLRRYEDCRNTPQGSMLTRRRGGVARSAVGSFEYALGLELLGWDFAGGVVSLVFAPHDRDNCQIPVWVHLEPTECGITGWRERGEAQGMSPPDDSFDSVIGQWPLVAWEDRIDGLPFLHVLWSNGLVTSLGRHEQTLPILVHEDLVFVAEQATLAPVLALFRGR